MQNTKGWLCVYLLLGTKPLIYKSSKEMEIIMSKLDTFKMLEKAGKFAVTAIIAAGSVGIAAKGKNVLDKSIEDGLDKRDDNLPWLGKIIMGKPRKKK